MTATATIVLLMIVGFLLLFLEIFLPGGIMGIIGAIMFLIGIFLGFHQYGTEVGFAMLGGTIVISFCIIYLGIKFFPHSPLGRRIILRHDEGKEEGYSSQETEIASFLGKTGVAVSILRPSGMADFDGHRVDVIAEGEYIENGARVVVTKVDGNRVVVDRAPVT